MNPISIDSAAAQLVSELNPPSWKCSVWAANMDGMDMIVVEADDDWIAGKLIPEKYLGYSVRISARQIPSAGSFSCAYQ